LGVNNSYLTCGNCKKQTHIDVVETQGCRSCNAPGPPKQLITTTAAGNSRLKFDTTRNQQPPSKKRIVGIYNAKGVSPRKFEFVKIPEKKPEHVRVVCVSDTHNQESKLEIPDADILIHAGDFTMKGEEDAVENFANWLDGLKNVKHKIVIAGNHDVTFDSVFWNKKWRGFSRSFFDPTNSINKLASKCTYLLDSETTVEGIRIYGSPWQPEFCDWAFNVVGDAIKSKWDLIPTGIDILVTHGPPKNHGGVCLPSQFDAGCPHLLQAITRTKPKIHVAGHIHEGYGYDEENGVHFINASNVNLQYQTTNNPIVFDITRL